MTLVLDSVTTEDAVPTSAPHRVSSQALYTAFTVRYTISGPGPIQAHRLHFEGNSTKTGTVLASDGAICGLAVCGASRPLAIATPHQFTIAKAYADLPSRADGSYPVNIYAWSNEVFQ